MKSVAKFDDIGWPKQEAFRNQLRRRCRVLPGWSEDNRTAWDIPVEKQCGNIAGS